MSIQIVLDAAMLEAVNFPAHICASEDDHASEKDYASEDDNVTKNPQRIWDSVLARPRNVPERLADGPNISFEIPSIAPGGYTEIISGGDTIHLSF